MTTSEATVPKHLEEFLAAHAAVREVADRDEQERRRNRLVRDICLREIDFLISNETFSGSGYEALVASLHRFLKRYAALHQLAMEAAASTVPTRTNVRSATQVGSGEHSFRSSSGQTSQPAESRRCQLSCTIKTVSLKSQSKGSVGVFAVWA